MSGAIDQKSPQVSFDCQFVCEPAKRTGRKLIFERIDHERAVPLRHELMDVAQRLERTTGGFIDENMRPF
jgi:hypothetical protein